MELNKENTFTEDILVFKDGSWITVRDFEKSFKPHAKRLRDNGIDENDDDVTG